MRTVTVKNDGKNISLTIDTLTVEVDVTDLYCSLELIDARVPEGFNKDAYLEDPFICPNCYSEDGGDVTEAKIVDDRLELTIVCECTTQVTDIFDLEEVLNLN